MIAPDDGALSMHLVAAPEPIFPYLTDPARYVT
jgi:hypothetical protein